MQKGLSNTKATKIAQKGVRHFLKKRKHTIIQMEDIMSSYCKEIIGDETISQRMAYMHISTNFNKFNGWYCSKYSTTNS